MRLRQLTLEILDDAVAVHGLRPAVLALVGLLDEHGARARSDDISAGETRLGDGLALSPTMAAMCAQDYARTAVFLRGLHQAIRDAHDRAPQRPVRVLYAGSGPYALLATPLMSVLTPAQVQFTILDIHEESVASARRVVDGLGLGAFVSALTVADACRYRISPTRTPDIIVSETMNACLAKEPQVSIWRHLLAQAPDATLIPDSVRVDAELVDLGREFAFSDPDGGMRQPPARDRIFVGTVFELTAETVRSWDPAARERLPAGSLVIPSPRPPRHDLMLFTRIRVYRDAVLEDYQSGLTVPRPLPYPGSLSDGREIELHYQLGAHPGLVCE